MTWLNLVELSKLWQFSDILDQVANVANATLLPFTNIYTLVTQLLHTAPFSFN